MEAEIDVSSLHMIEDKAAKIKCVMNTYNILDSELTFSTASCMLCPDLKDNICMECLSICHENHNGDNKIFVENTPKISETFCSCAENGHKQRSVSRESDSGVIKRESLNCNLNEVLYSANANYYYMDSITHSYYCLYCFLNCIDKKEDQKDAFEKKDRKKFQYGPPKCSCTNQKNHSTDAANLKCIENILLNEEYDEYLNLNQIPGNIISKQALLEKYLQPIINTNMVILDTYHQHLITEDTMKNIPEVYTSSLHFLATFIKIYGKHNVLINNPSLLKTFDFETLNMIFPAEDIDDALLIENKIYCLYFFRVYYLLPLIKPIKKYDVNMECENVNPLHRLILKKDIKEIFEITQIDKKRFFYLFTRICDSISRYAIQVHELHFIAYLTEYLNWCIFLASFRFSQQEDVNHIFKKVLIDNFIKTVEIAKNRKIMLPRVKKRIEKFIKLIFIGINDEIFYREVFCFSENKKINEEEDKFAKFELSTLTKIISSKHNIFSSNDKFIELEEEKSPSDNVVHENDTFCRESGYSKYDFAFEKGAIQNDIIHALFGYKKDNKDTKEEISTWEIYDWFVNENDYYIETIQEFAKSSQSYPLAIRDFIMPYKYINIQAYCSIFDYENIIKCFNQLDKLLVQYFDATIEELAFFNSVATLLTDTITNIALLFDTNKSNPSQNTLIQILLYKKGCFDSLFLMYQILNRNESIQNRIGKDKAKAIIQSVFDLFEILTNNNILLVAIFFTKSSINIFYSQTSNEKSDFRCIKTKFYLSMLKQTLHTNIKMALILFVDRIIKGYSKVEIEILNNKEAINQEYLKEINSILRTMKKCLKARTDKSNLKMNSLIANLIISILRSQLFASLWSNYQNTYNDKSMEITQINKTETSFVLSVFKLINAMDDYYFYILNKEIPEFELRAVLENNINEMSLRDRRILSMTYAKIYVITPFSMIKVLTKDDMNLMIKQADNNLNGKVIVIRESDPQKNFKTKDSKEAKKEEVFKEKKSVLTAFLRKKTSNNIDAKKAVGPSSILIQALKIDEKSLGMEPVFMNLIKYRRHMKLYLHSYFKCNSKMFVKYFKDVVLIPSTYAIYKVLYFSPVLSAKYKYLAYKTVYLFLECYKYFIETIMLDPVKLWEDEEFKNEIDKFFILQEEIPDLTTLLRGVKDKLAYDVPKMAKDPKFEPLKTKILLDYFFRYINQIKPLSFLSSIIVKNNCNEDNNENGNDQNEMNDLMVQNNAGPREIEKAIFKKKIDQFIDYYIEKKKDFNNNIIIDLFQTENEDNDLKAIDLKRTIVLDLLFRLKFSNQSDFPTGYEEKYILIDVINKIFKANPDLWHDIIADISFYTKQIIKDITAIHLPYLLQLIYIDYHKLRKNKATDKKDPKSIEYFLILIEYLRLHCENHHKLFQTILTSANISRGEDKSDDLDFVNFILKIPVMAMNNVLYFESKSEFIGKFKPSNKTFFNNLLVGVTNYLIEIIQGSLVFNMRRFNLTEPKPTQNEPELSRSKRLKDNKKTDIINKDFEAYIDIGYLCFDKLENEQSEFFLSQFFRFIICFFEESLNPRINKEEIVKKFNPKKLIQGLIHSTCNLYLHYTSNEKLNPNSNLPENFSEELSKIYLSEDDIQDNKYFVLSSSIFRFFKIAEQWRCGDKISHILKEIQKECEEKLPINEKNKNYIIGRRESYSFFSIVIREVEIFYRPKDTSSELERRKYRDFFSNTHDFDRVEDELRKTTEGSVQKVVYAIVPDSLFVTEKDMMKFTESAPLDKNVKLNYLLEYIPNMETDIKMRKLLWEKKSKVVLLLYRINYLYANYISIFLAVVVNVLILISSFYQITIYSLDEYTFSHDNPYGEDNADLSKYILNKKRKEVNSFSIFLVSLFHLIFLALVICNWFYFSFIRIQLFQKTNEEEGRKKKQGFLMSVITLLYRSEIFPLCWNFLTGIIAILSIKFHFLFSLQLFTVFTLFETMRTIIYSVKIKYKQFLSAGLLMIIFSMFYSLVKFQWFSDDDDEDCLTFTRCFLSIVTNGIRGGGGMGFPLKKIHEKHYYSEFLFEWVFYFSLILILLNVVNGIIVDTFQALREQANEEYETKMNMCFICSLKRSTFERIGIDFEMHKEREHNVLNYFHYIFKVIFTDDQELNSLDYQVLLTVRQLRTDFFPIKTSLAISGKEES